MGLALLCLERLALGAGHRRAQTGLAWHRKGFRLFWTWKVRHGQPGRPVSSREVRDLIRKMPRENPSCGAPWIHGELLKLGIDIGESCVNKYMRALKFNPHILLVTFGFGVVNPAWR
jgi:hypothetical protein